MNQNDPRFAFIVDPNFNIEAKAFGGDWDLYFGSKVANEIRRLMPFMRCKNFVDCTKDCDLITAKF